MKQTIALRLSGIIAITTALYHSLSGDAILRVIDMNSADLAFVRATHQIGATGWIAGGVLLLIAPSFNSTRAISWVVNIFSLVYGIPAIGNFVLSNGKPNIGWIGLAAVVILAQYGRWRGGQSAKYTHLDPPN